MPHIDPFDEEDRPVGPVQDSEALLREGRRFQLESGIPFMLGRKPRFLPWVLLAVLLIVISAGIELFWPLPGRHGPLPACQQDGAGITLSCQRNMPGSHRMAGQGEPAGPAASMSPVTGQPVPEAPAPDRSR